MWPRILIGGIVGGILIFIMGFASHGILGLQGRTLLNIPESSAFTDYLKERGWKHGLYVFPDMPSAADQKDAEKMKELNERYKAGPSGMLLIVHPGEDMMNMETLGKEFVSNLIAAFIAAWIVSLMAVEVGFARRWQAVLLMGLLAWCSISASYGIWYRFPHDFIHDELLCAALEWGLAGLAIAAIVRPKPAAQANTLGE
jgi:hypothetical protein